MQWIWLVLFFGIIAGFTGAVVNNLQKTRLGRILLIVASVVVIGVVFADIVAAFIGYRSIYVDIRNTGMIGNPDIMKVVAVVLALICYLTVGEVMRNLWRLNIRRAVYWLVGWLVILWSSMGYLSQNQLFNPLGPRFSYQVLPNGKIVLRDKALAGTPDPETGEKLKLLTPEVAKIYWQQREEEKNRQQDQERQKSMLNTGSNEPREATAQTVASPNVLITQPSKPRQEFLLGKVKLSFDSCEPGGGGVVCIFSAVNIGQEDAEFNWFSKIEATDSHGNVHYPKSLDVGGYSWPGDCWFHYCFADFFHDNLIPNVFKKLHVGFGDIDGTENALQNLRLSVSAGAWWWNSTKTLDFVSLPINRPMVEPSPTVNSLIEPVSGGSATDPEIPKQAEPVKAEPAFAEQKNYVECPADECGLIVGENHSGTGNPVAQSGIREQLTLPVEVQTNPTPHGYRHLEVSIARFITIHNVPTMPDATHLQWRVSSGAPWLNVRRNLGGQETSGIEGPGGYSKPPLAVTVDSAGLQPGTYRADITIRANDPANKELAIPVTLIITGTVPKTASVENADSVYRVGNGVSAPSVLYKLEPQYTEQARMAKLSGIVQLSVEVDPLGYARNIRVVRSLGMGLDEKAIEAISRWRFRPGYKDGRAVTVEALIQVEFRLL